MLTVLYVVVLRFKAFNNNQKLCIMSFVSGLSRDHLSRKIGY